MVVLRLSRLGKKNHATFRIIASDKRKDTVGTYLELLGTYDPHRTPTMIELKEDRVKYWLSVGAQPSDTVHNLLVEKGLITADKKKLVNIKKVEPTAETPAAAAPTTDAPAAPAEQPPAETPAAVAEKPAA